MELQSSGRRKRSPTASHSPRTGAKRKRFQDFSCHEISYSVDKLLSVPLDYIFREVPSSQASSTQQRRKPLLTRSEAHCLIRISQLAYEVDCLLEVSSLALETQVQTKTLRQRIEQLGNHPILRPVLPILSIHGEYVPNSSISNAQDELDRVIYQLMNCASSLRQFAEQNLTVSDSLLDALGDLDYISEGINDSNAQGHGLAREKRALGEIEEELHTRIERLLGMAATDIYEKDEDQNKSSHNADDTLQISVDAFDHAQDALSGEFISMSIFCSRAVGEEFDESEPSTLEEHNRMGKKLSNQDVTKERAALADLSTTKVTDHDIHSTPKAETTRVFPSELVDSDKKEATKENVHSNNSSFSSQDRSIEKEKTTTSRSLDEILRDSQSTPFSARTRAAEALAVLSSGLRGDAQQYSPTHIS